MTLVLTPEQFAARFDGMFSESTFRLELLAHYTAPSEELPFRRFLAGERVDPCWREPWKRLVRSIRDSGRLMRRVHVVAEPLSKYLQFELTCAYPASVEAGEDVRILPASVAKSLSLPKDDYWLFDSCRVGLMRFDSAGSVLAIELIDDQSVVDHYSRGRDLALTHSIPLVSYQAGWRTKEERDGSRQAL